MYERNAIVIDRFFTELFGYDQVNNLKGNYQNYCDLISKLKRYQEISNKENDIMVDFEKVASDIKSIQKMQESYYKKCIKLQQTRKELFNNLEDNADVLKRKFDKINDEINKNNEEIEINVKGFINKISEFSEKSANRTQCGRERRIIENEYEKSLQNITENYKKIEFKYISNAKDILKQNNTDDIKENIRLELLKNGQKEKVPFNMDVINKTINIVTEIEMKKIDIFIAVYEKTGRLLNEIRNDSVKIEKHEKFAIDSKSKLNFLSKFIDYIISFLDNERLNIVGGEKEHKKLMESACKNFESDLIQIKNLYEIIIKEISGKATKKMYKDLYKPEYVQGLIESEKQFEKSISKLNVIGTIIYPDYWRLDGMQKILEQFKLIVTGEYNRDLMEYEPIYVGLENAKSVEEPKIDDEQDTWDFEDEGFAFSSEDEKDKNEDIIIDNYEDEEKEEQGFNVDEYDEDEIENDNDEEQEEDNEEYEDDESEEEYEEDEEDDDDIDFYIEEDDVSEDENEDDIEYEYDDEDRVIDEILGFNNKDDYEEKKSNSFYTENAAEDDDDNIDFSWDDEEDYEDDEDEILDKKQKGRKLKTIKKKK